MSDTRELYGYASGLRLIGSEHADPGLLLCFLDTRNFRLTFRKIMLAELHAQHQQEHTMPGLALDSIHIHHVVSLHDEQMAVVTTLSSSHQKKTLESLSPLKHEMVI